MAVFENHDLVNSFYAVRIDSRGHPVRCEPDERGFITAMAGDEFRFPNPHHPDQFVPVNALTFEAGTTALKILINDNELYPFYLSPHQRRGMEKIKVTRFRLLTDSSFYFEGMTA